MLASFSAPSGGAIGAAAVTGLLAAACWGLGCLLFDAVHARRSASELPPSPAGMNLFKNSLATTVFVIAGLVMGSSYPGSEAFWPLFWSGVVGFAVGDTLYFAAFPLAGVQATAMVGNLTPPIAGLIGWLFFKETFDASSLGWMAVVLAGVSLVILDPKKSQATQAPRDRRKVGLGLLFALAAAISQAVAIVVAHKSFQGVEVLPGTVVRLVGGLVAAIAIAAIFSLSRRGRQSPAGLTETLRPLGNRTLMRALLIPTFFATLLALPLHSATIQIAPGHISALLLSTSPLFILPLGFKFGVRQGPVSIVGVVVGFGGVLGLVS